MENEAQHKARRSLLSHTVLITDQLFTHPETLPEEYRKCLYAASRCLLDSFYEEKERMELLYSLSADELFNLCLTTDHDF